ncbi:glycosyl hydrolase family 53 [Cohnella sp. REN36]|uniref:glycoside hydrolase family 113 n=1 Tax=Cohnella sp. REN36 TaxID=2887347 RepID=UPI001D154D9A|nr:glycosyl hydrolase family 53 [Cohnella sp. REN36]MCC3376814.1 glycosyl hydrolase family 53 [Cohnella sp. REN36]
MKGMTHGWDSQRGAYRQPYALDSLRKLKETGSEWIALSFYTYQANTHATEIPFDYGHTMTDRDIEFAVNQSKALGLKVCLKPVVNSRDGIWRAHIGFPDEEAAQPYWDAWFESYGNFLCHYAEIAEELGCEMFCIGCEMAKTESRKAEWHALIERVRSIYGGPLVYNANHGSEEGVAWFDQVDVIGTSAYYPVARKPGDGEDAMLANWQPVRAKLRRLHEKFGKPIVFMKIGCRSALGCASMPWDYLRTELPASEEEQANFYGSVLRAFWDEPWFGGFFWWDWSVRLYPLEQASADTGFDIYGKKAERVLREWYAKTR